MSQSFVHLRVHTEFSLVDGIVKIKPLIAETATANMPAVAITDLNNMYGQVKFYKACQNAGIKPIVAADLLLRDEDGSVFQLPFLAQTLKGYKNLTELISRAWTQGQRAGVAAVKREWIEELSEGLIVLSGGIFGDVGKALLQGHPEVAEERCDWWTTHFPDRFYLEVNRCGRIGDEQHLHAAVELSHHKQIPLVATNDVRFLKSEDFDVHEARVCIHDGYTLGDKRRQKIYTDQQYLRSAKEMETLFADLPEALANSVVIAQRCNVEIELGTYYLPDFPIPEGMTQDEFFTKISYEGLTDRLDFLFGKDHPEWDEIYARYAERLQFELDIIIQMGFPGYFLIVMDFIKWAKDHAIPVGPGRGSGAGSLVAYVLLITDLDPLEYDLLFERFLNPERVSMPDFDVDFCMEDRDKVISYVADNYGRDAVSQIITFGTMAAKAVVRDVARVLAKSYGLADKLSKLIPADPGMSLAKALEEEAQLGELLKTDEDAQEIWDMAVRLEGTVRNVGKHAGGVVIAPTKLIDFAPLYSDEDGSGLVTQFDKNDVEEAGLVKFDFLGLRTLTIIDWAIEMIDRRRALNNEPPVDISKIPLDDPATYTLLKKAETTAVFQLESRGMKELILRLEPDNIEEMIALVALFRPGPLQSGMVDDFINRKHGRAEVAYPDKTYQHECLVPILEPTYGVIVYQEQVMQIAQELAGYSLGQADLLRRAMGKKKPEEMAKQRSSFEEGAAKQGIDPQLAIRIFDLVEKFAGYGFNKSHSAAYAIVSYQTAWLKAHYPAEFMAATMSSDMDKTEKVVTFIEECRHMGLEILPPDVNRGELKFSVDEQGRIIYGLGAIKGLGEGPVESILDARKDQPIEDLFDFCSRTDPKRVNKRAIEALIYSGAFDSIGPQSDNISANRAALLAAVPEAVKAADQTAKSVSAGLDDLFGGVGPDSFGDENVYEKYTSELPWTLRERLDHERDTLGLYLTGHPIDEYEDELRRVVRYRLRDLRADKNKQRLVGLVVDIRAIKTKRGDTMLIVKLDDRTGQIDIAMFSDLVESNRNKIQLNSIIVVEGEVSQDNFTGGLKARAHDVMRWDESRSKLLANISIELSSSQATVIKQNLKSLFCESPGECPVVLRYSTSSAVGEVSIDQSCWVTPTDELLQSLRQRFGESAVVLNYR
ncbi:DNA polymerase III subunit alpha [uncultured Umboniibacter sp.]|uniref:DNA polymerase III subunit alpha n=1 Tax=uncultured Umboniibacter sp. TaxID=1798917 RepID=UPI0026382753|nr:DNA polymerase III subunit alpha [uncultured Umboniibacter sp.]